MKILSSLWIRQIVSGYQKYMARHGKFCLCLMRGYVHGILGDGELTLLRQIVTDNTKEWLLGHVNWPAEEHYGMCKDQSLLWQPDWVIPAGFREDAKGHHWWSECEIVTVNSRKAHHLPSKKAKWREALQPLLHPRWKPPQEVCATTTGGLEQELGPLKEIAAPSSISKVSLPNQEKSRGWGRNLVRPSHPHLRDQTTTAAARQQQQPPQC